MTLRRFARSSALLGMLGTLTFCGAGGAGWDAGAPTASRFGLTASGRPSATMDALGYLADDDGTAGGSAKEDADEPATTWKRSRIVPNTSKLEVGNDETLPMEGMQVTVEIAGHRARVLLDQFYRNDREQSFHGNFFARLPNGASPYFFAFGETVAVDATAAAPSPISAQFVGMGGPAASLELDAPTVLRERSSTWTEPKVARMVPREKAAHAYIETTRRNIDPALLEWQGAGVFSAMVFPLAPGKLHRIVLGYDVDLVQVGDELEYRLELPREVKDLGLTLRVIDPWNAAKVTPAMAVDYEEGVLQLSTLDLPDRTLTVRVPDTRTIALSDVDAKTGEHFVTSFVPDMPETAASASPRAVFLLDTSLSSSPERFNVWLALMRSVLDANRGELTEFAVLLFDVETSWWRREFVPNTPENVDALMAFADELSLQGATDLGSALAEGASPAWFDGGRGSGLATHDLFLLSDGAATWGGGDPAELRRALGSGSARALFAYHTGLLGEDTQALAQLSRDSGGALFSVTGESAVAAASKAHTKSSWRIADVASDGCTDLLLGGRPSVVYPGQRLYLAGRGRPQDGQDVVLTLERDGERHVVRRRIDSVVRTPIAPRAYGEIAVAQLEELGDVTEEASVAYASHFRVVGRTCSLLMLEAEEDYEQYGIHPEEHAALVRQRPASTLIADAEDEAQKALGSARGAFMAFLARLERIPGAEVSIPMWLTKALSQMPDSSFDVRTDPLTCKARTWDDVPGWLQEQLASHDLAYVELSEEAARLRDRLGPADGLRTLSSLVEQRAGDAPLARDVGFTAMQWGLGGQAYHLFRRVARARPFEPESYRALAQCLEAEDHTDLAMAYHEVALLGKWDARFGDYREIARTDYLRLLRRIERGETRTSVPEFAAKRLKELSREVRDAGAGLVVVMSWNTDRTDVDLHVIDADGEECYYSHRQTDMGGRITQDVTQGYGPEMFVLPEPEEGEYRIRVRYFATDNMRASLRTKVHVRVIRHLGAANESVTEHTVTLETGKEVHDIATFEIED